MLYEVITPVRHQHVPGALSAACWAAMVATGEQGYLDSARKILAVAEQIKTAIDSIPELFVLGNPLFVIAFGAYELDIYRIQESMSRKGWSLNGLHRPRITSYNVCYTKLLRAYEYWRTSGTFRHFDPMGLLTILVE